MKVKNIFFLLLLLLIGNSIFGQSWNIITGKNRFKDSVAFLKPQNNITEDSVLTLTYSTGVLKMKKVTNSVIIPVGVDSITLYFNQLCYWIAGIPTCFFLQPSTFGANDSLHLNFDSTWILHYSNGTLLSDSIFLIHTVLYTDNHFQLTPNYLGDPYTQLLEATRLVDSVYESPFATGFLYIRYATGQIDSVQGGGGGGTQTLQQVFDNDPLASPNINAHGGFLSFDSAEFSSIARSGLNIGIIGSESSNARIANLYNFGNPSSSDASIIAQAPDTATVHAEIRVNSTDYLGVTTTSGINITSGLTSFDNSINGIGKLKVIFHDPDVMLTTPTYVYVPDNDTVKVYPFPTSGITPEPTFRWSVLDSLSIPPVSPSTGDIYEISTAGTGVWSGHNTEITTWDGAAWTFESANSGDLLFRVSNDLVSRYSGTVWIRVGKVPLVAGGNAIGAQLRAGTTDGQTFAIMTGGTNRMLFANGGAITIPPLIGTGNALIGINAGGVISRAIGALTRQIITSGSTATVTGGDYIVTIDPTSTLAAMTLTLPASPSDLQTVQVDFGGTLTSGTIVTALTISPNSGQTILDNTPPITATTDNTLFYRYRTANTKWYRFKP